MSRLKEAAEKAKIELSGNYQTQVNPIHYQQGQPTRTSRYYAHKGEI